MTASGSIAPVWIIALTASISSDTTEYPKFSWCRLPLTGDAFGPERMMWGSDWPPSAGREGYANTLRGVMEHPAFKGDGELEQVMGLTAKRVWGF